ncbi:hypothetical protein BKA64DRAFT_353683 [Cadophora sp. MPI-SDFR-AT-0126]|nr:hypothetical protein BKA64DRAFT_353683 [Leotiomycetes sp. MPI-SDFR-AT-0126]
MPPSQWDHKADKDLLLAIIDEGALKSIVWPKIALAMQAKGYTFTHEACRQHFQKIRKQSSTNGTSTPTSSPKKKATPRKTAKAADYSANMNDDEDDDEDLPPPPSSKRKRVVKKEENGFGSGVDDGERGTYQFKIEQLGGAEHAHVVDLEHDDLYDDEA